MHREQKFMLMCYNNSVIVEGNIGKKKIIINKWNDDREPGNKRN